MHNTPYEIFSQQDANLLFTFSFALLNIKPEINK